MQLPDLIFDNPVLTGILILLLGIGVYYQRRLGPEDDWIERVTRALAVLLDPLARKLGRPLTIEKGPADYVFSTKADPDEVEEAIMDYGYRRNELSMEKFRRPPDGTKQWAVGQFRWVEAGEDWQHHVYLFPGTGVFGTDIYAHKEPRYDQEDPEEHLTGEQEQGHPGMLDTALATSNVAYAVNPMWASS